MIYGRIYKIYCNETGECYYGSTEETLSRRLSFHKTSFKSWKNGKSRYVTAFKIIERGNFTISLMEEGEFQNKSYMKARERHYIENCECVNKNVPNRTDKEWREANIEQILEKKKEYYEVNQQQILEKMKERYEINKEKILEKQKEYQEANNEQIAEKKKQKITCECGSVICRVVKNRHEKSKKHLNHLSLHTPLTDLNLNPSFP